MKTMMLTPKVKILSSYMGDKPIEKQIEEFIDGLSYESNPTITPLDDFKVCILYYEWE